MVKVLIIDDSAFQRKILSNILLNLGLGDNGRKREPGNWACISRETSSSVQRSPDAGI